MARFVATDYNITINGENFSDSIAAVTMDITSEEQDVTAFGGSGYRSRIGGLKDASVSLDFHQDFGAAAVDATLFPLLGSQATVVVKPTSGTVSATNPSYTGVFLVSQYTPFASTVGDLSTLSVSWNLAGTAGIVRGTA
jgi:predicted secreted protein